MYKEKEEEEQRPRQSPRMLRNEKKREKRGVKAKQGAQRTVRQEKARRLRQQARKLRQHARQVRKRARQVIKKGEVPLGPEKKVKTKRDERKGKLVNQEVKKILMRAPLKPSERLQNCCEGKGEKVKRGSNFGWKAGMRQAALEPAPARRRRTLSTSEVLKLLKKAMNLAAKKVGSKESKTDKASPEVKETATPSHAKQQTAPPPDKSDQGALTSPKEDFKSFKLHSETPEDRGANEQEVTLQDIGPDLSADTPDLWKRVNEGSLTPDNSEVREGVEKAAASSGDKEEMKGQSKAKAFKELAGDLRGGGAGGSNYYTWLRLAQQIMVGVRRAQLPLRLPMNDITDGDGNCYFRALCSQCQRPEVAAPEEIRHLDHRAMRKKICNFMLKSRLRVVLDFRRRWGEFGLGNYEQYWTDMAESRGEIWAEGPVIHATAWYLERHIYVVSEKATPTDPFLSFSGNKDGTDGSCAGAPLWLGHLTGLHYQTLLLDQSEILPLPPKMQTIEETLKSKARGTVKGGDQQTSQPGASRNSSEGEVSVIHSNSYS